MPASSVHARRHVGARRASSSVIVIAAVLVAGATTWSLAAQDAGASAAAQWQYERDTLQQALRSARAQLDERGQVPPEVRDAFQAARTQADAFRSAAQSGATVDARRHYRSAMRSLERVVRWMVEQDAAAAGESSDVAPEHRARERLKRLSTRITKLARKAQALDLDLDFSVARAAALEGKAALEARDPEAARSALRALVSLLDSIEQEIRVAADARADAEVDQ